MHIQIDMLRQYYARCVNGLLEPDSKSKVRRTIMETNQISNKLSRFYIHKPDKSRFVFLSKQHVFIPQ